MMLLAQHPDFSGLEFQILLDLFLGITIPLTLVASVIALYLIVAGRRRATSTRFLAFGSLFLVVPASLVMAWVFSHPSLTYPSPFGIVWQIMAAASLLCSAAASIVASGSPA